MMMAKALHFDVHLLFDSFAAFEKLRFEEVLWSYIKGKLLRTVGQSYIGKMK